MPTLPPHVLASVSPPQLGWAGPVKSLWSDIWPAGQWSTHVLPAAVENPKNFIKIWPDWSQEGAKNKLFIQYRWAAAARWGSARRRAGARVCH